MTRLAAAAVLAGALLVAPAASAASPSTVLGCGAYEGAVKKDVIYWYARVYNACGSARKMRAVVDLWPDGPCEWVGAYSRADLYAGVQIPSGTADC
ncbi:hypothetical protein HTZ77_11080 [Nonomuraea sp. SMC257]|uniref:Alpha-amylase n=1 Tax=Nonomuraea montanisoli TaxID=2741721 RepID=A0A7Y6M1S9_9ACTN|nr:hypothetical protein [Nonomuraea montanisoli]NUW31968.1 hypothetical protein [Nonomuraea montanisoli]